MNYKNIIQTKNKKINIKVNGRIVGAVVGNEFRKTIHTNWILRTPPALANDVQALHDAENAGATTCVFNNADKGIIYRASISKIWDMGFNVNRGFGEQIALTLNLWTQERDPKHKSRADAETPAFSEPTRTMPLTYKSKAITGTQFTKNSRQLGLWEGRK